MALSAARQLGVLEAVTVSSAALTLPPGDCDEDAWQSSEGVLKIRDQEVKRTCHVPKMRSLLSQRYGALVREQRTPSLSDAGREE